MNFWGLKTFMMVTGASKGMGRECAIEFSKRVGPGSVCFLVGRTLTSLEPVKKILLKNQKDSSFKVQMFAQNMEKPDGNILERNMNEFLTLNLTNPTDFEHAMIIHGAPTLFKFRTNTLELQKVEDLQRYFTVNTFAPTLMTGSFMKIFKNKENAMRTVINITSDAAERPTNTLSTICAGSAAREVYMSTIARENNGILVLNYNPGLLDIYAKGLESWTDVDVKEYCRQNVTTCEQTVEKLITVLEGRKFFSGEHLSFSDLK